MTNSFGRIIFNQMVNYQIQTLDAVFGALSDPTRRSILSQLAAGGKTVTELAKPFEMSLPAITKHLNVLEKAGLIKRGRESRWRPCTLEPAPLKIAASWLDDYRRLWESRLDRLEEYLEQLQHEEKKRAKRRRR